MERNNKSLAGGIADQKQRIEAPQVQSAPPTRPQNFPQSKPKATPLDFIKIFKEKTPKRYLSRIGIGCAVIFGFLLAYGMVFITGADTLIFKLKMEGLIVNSKGFTPIEGARIIIDGEVKATTNADGYYRVSGLNKGDLDLTLEADGFFSDNVTVNLDRSPSNYTNEKNFQLTSSEVGILEGRFLIDKIGYDFSEDRILIEDKSYTVNSDGTFKIDDITVGETLFIFESSSYVDIEEKINILAGENKLKDIELVAAGDIDERFLDYISGENLTDVNVEANNIANNRIKISEDGNLKIKDLEIGKEYLLRISADGYLTRDYPVTIIQGVNRIPALEMVRVGTIYYSKATSRNDQYQIFSSDYDGLNETQETTLADLEAYDTYQESEDSIIFLSEINNIRGNTYRGDIPLYYQYNPKTGDIAQITRNTGGLDTAFIDTSNTWFVNVYKENRRDETSRIEVRNRDGSVADVVTTIDEGLIKNAIVSHSSRYVYFVVETDSEDTLYAWNGVEVREIASGAEINLEDVEVEGNIALYTSLEGNGFTSLKSYNFATKEIRQLDNNTFGKFFNFINESNNEFVYVDSFNNRESIYSFNISGNRSEKLIDLAQNDSVLGIMLQDRDLFYITKDKGMSVLNLEAPRAYVNVIRDLLIRF